MKKITNIDELINELESLEYNYYGLRGATEHDLEVADRGYLDCSLDLWDERDCDFDEDAELLNGTSAIEVDKDFDKCELKARYEMALGYATIHHDTKIVYLLGDSDSEYGTDDKEVVLGSNGYGANIIAIVEL